MYLGDRAWPELGEYLATERTVLIPMGSTEQHGPHLPLATDHLIAEHLAHEAAQRSDCLCTPTVNVGVSPHHRQFHGTMWVDGPAFRQYVESLTRNLTYHGLDRIIYVNAHGGNVVHLREVGRRLRDAGEGFAVEWMWDESIPDLVDELFPNKGPHGGPKETAMLMHIKRDLVREDRLTDARDGGLVDWQSGGRTHGARTFYDAIDNTDNGVLGDQTEATPEKGARLFDAACDQLTALIDWLRDKDQAELLAKPHVEPQPGSNR